MARFLQTCSNEIIGERGCGANPRGPCLRPLRLGAARRHDRGLAALEVSVDEAIGMANYRNPNSVHAPIRAGSENVHRGRGVGNIAAEPAFQAQIQHAHMGEGMSIAVAPPLSESILALGGELENTICLARRNTAWVSAPHGDLVESSNYRAFLKTVEKLRANGEDHPGIIAHDLHPTYLSTRYAERQLQPTVAVQHHHAHAVSCAIDSGMTLPVVGVVCDGTGYGTDGAIWGGEVLLCSAQSFRRVAHLDYFELPGGDVAARWTWRPALALLRAAFPASWRRLGLPGFDAVPSHEHDLVARQLDAGLNTPRTSSLGRLFDAVAFLSGICAHNDHEGKAAIELEDVARESEYPACNVGVPYPFDIAEGSDAPATIDWRPMIRDIVGDVLASVDVSTISARFHATLVAIFAAAAELAVRESGVDRVVLSGGRFDNELLRRGLKSKLEARGIRVAIHQRVSCGDAGLSLGQAVIAAAVAAKLPRKTQGA